MKTTPIVPADIDFDSPGHPGQAWSRQFTDIYHARLGALAQCRHVFLGGNGLPGRWQGRERFVVLETGFGLGHNFLATWAAWRDDPQRSGRLSFISIELHPPSAADLRRAHAGSPLADLAERLDKAWPEPVCGLHRLDLGDAQVELLLAFGDAARWLPELVAQVDAFYLDGFTPNRNAAMWEPRVFRACARLAAPEATAATWTVARTVRDGLSAAGFEVQRAPGFGDKREMLLARLRPSMQQGGRHAAARPVHSIATQPPGRRAAARARSALVIGAGLAGAAAARALAAQGLTVQVLDRGARPASETSGNAGGLFHGVLHPEDGAHAQALRAAALLAERQFRPLIDSGRVRGALDGLLRGEAEAGRQPKVPARMSGAPPDAEAADECAQALGAMNALLLQQAVPPAFARALDRETAAALAGMPLADPAWLFGGGGWLNPGDLVRAWLESSGITLHSGARVDRLQPVPRDGAHGWQALDDRGALLAEADVAVVAGAAAGLSLLAPWSEPGTWALRTSRGQVSLLDAAQAGAARLPRPHLPVAGGGYMLALPGSLGGGVLVGATSQPDDPEPGLRSADHRSNLAQLEALSGQRWPVADDALAGWSGRVGWRLAAADRLPVIGPVPQPITAWRGLPRSEQARFVPRVEGLYVLTALGSRGITLAPWLGELLAAWITGAPCPVASSLLDALDVGRFAARAVRQAAAARGG